MVEALLSLESYQDIYIAESCVRSEVNEFIHMSYVQLS